VFTTNDPSLYRGLEGADGGGIVKNSITKPRGLGVAVGLVVSLAAAGCIKYSLNLTSIQFTCSYPIQIYYLVLVNSASSVSEFFSDYRVGN